MACTIRALPPFKIDVSLWDIAVAWFNGAGSNAVSAAFLSNVDDQGEEVYGAETWFRDSFAGKVYPATSIAGFSGRTDVPIEKPCNAKAADGAMPGSSGGGSGDGDGNPVGGGSNPLEGCGTDVVTGCTTVEGITNCQTNTFIICGMG